MGKWGEITLLIKEWLPYKQETLDFRCCESICRKIHCIVGSKCFRNSADAEWRVKKWHGKNPSEKTMLFFTNALFHGSTVLWRGSMETSSEVEGFSNQSFEQPDNSSMKKVSLIVVKMKRRLHSTIENNGTPNRCFSRHPVIVVIRQLGHLSLKY